jgi:hypothetical protein
VVKVLFKGKDLPAELKEDSIEDMADGPSEN